MRDFLNTAAIAIASLATAAGIVAFADPANAGVTATDQASLIVPTHDLDLASPEGRATARMRIAHAAERVCDYDGEMLSPSGLCRQKAVDAARQVLDNRIAAR